MGFEFEEGKPYVMPAHFGPSVEGWNGRAAHYADNTSITVMYATEKEAVSKYLPPGFKATDPPLISVSFVMCRGVDFMAGGGYNLVAVNVSAEFEGRRDRVTGNFALVLWENAFMPIMVGREVLGAPKLMADIPDAWIVNGKRGFSVSEGGILLLEGEIGDLTKASDEELELINRQARDAVWMGWKYIPSCDMKSSDASFATALPAATELTEAWLGKGHILFHTVAWKRAPMSARVINALKQLPIVEIQGGVITRGSQDLLIEKQYALK
ncbi:MAG: acetoacetate decarboxylase family protein [Desulfobacterales bacterium]